MQKKCTGLHQQLWPQTSPQPKIGPNPNNAPQTQTLTLIFSQTNESHSDAFTGPRPEPNPSSKPNIAPNTTMIQILLPKVSSSNDFPLTLGPYILRQSYDPHTDSPSL